MAPPVVLLMLALVAGSAHATTDAALAAIVDRRLQGDRTGACVAAAVIDGDRVARAWRCADASGEGRIGPDTAFEIGSVSKTMTAILLADLIVQGRASLDDPLSDYLPQGAAVPAFAGQPILLRHVVTHTSGLPPLPSRMGVPDPDDPYARLDAGALLASLGDVELDRAPGSRFQYSNFASMLLSWAVAQRSGLDFERLAKERLFAPLGMSGAYVGSPPEGVRPAAGHLPTGRPTPPWRFATDLAGVGGVRATLDDMVRYAQAQLGTADAPIAAAVDLAQRPVGTGASPPMAMNWVLDTVAGRTVHAHAGGTGGFSSYLAFDRERGRAVVLLSDTALHSLGGLDALGQHLLDEREPLDGPRKAARAPDALLDGLAGEYRLEGGAAMTLTRRGDALVLQVPGQPEVEMGYDDAGDFYPLEHDALLSPRQRTDGGYAFAWRQGGGMLAAMRIDGQAPAPDADALRGYAGTYRLGPGFDLAVRERDGTLHAQATGQGEFALAPAGEDAFEAVAYGIELRFRRNEDGAVDALELRQGGRTTRGERTGDADAPAPPAPAPDAGAAEPAGPLADYAGTYPLVRGFDLTVRERDGVLYGQATGQGEFALAPAGGDVFRAAAHGIELRFRRGGDGAVEALELRQSGQVMRGERR
ncbi:serine hydrolase [Luteimonas sp. Y-2-2-4F]|nr:serine hydrolase [Luteimonas sp. Y-2-2-4F]MCD9031396.1 serine hydrolase [Luteimonas sp. Y-2-2-4F]